MPTFQLYVTKAEMWAFKTKTIEVFYDAANSPGFPFSPRIGSELDLGCGAPDSVVNLDNLLMWMDGRGYIVESQIAPYYRNNNTGYKVGIVSTDAPQDRKS